MANAAGITQVGPDHFEAAFGLVIRFFLEEGFSTPADQIQSGLQSMLGDDDYAVFLARAGDVPVGVATVSTGLSIEYGHFAEIDELYVLPSHRGQGVGRQLIDAALGWCRARGCARVLLTITPEGEAAHGLIRFYGALGFLDTQRKILSLTI